jgi:S-formylglutathione hydrolase FrmB
MLHGAGGHYSEWVDYGLAETADELIREGKIGPLIVVFPQGDASYWTNHAAEDSERWGDYVLADVVGHTDATYRTLPGPRGRAIGGLSMGGVAALHLAFNHPDVFGAAGAHSPSLRIFEESAAFTTDAEQFARNDPLRLAAPSAAA